MRRLKVIPASILFSAALLLGASAQYAAKITVNSGNSFVVKKLNISGDRLFSDTGQASTSISSIAKIEFRYAGINLNMCESMFRSGDLKSLESLLQQYVGPTLKYSHLPTNIGDYLIWMLRVQIWNKSYTAAGKTIGIMRKMEEAEIVDAANMYFTFLLMEQGKIDEAKTVFDQVLDPEAVSVPMTEYIRGRFLFERAEYRQAIKKVAHVLASHSRNIEWMPPTTVLEAKIYKQTGQLRKAETVANELTMAYPGTQWSELGEDIKKEVQQ
jgi:tetratricopeptide (TPR) repeat protein